ncbi:MAG: class I SAM-dependent methyltransferase [Pseudomonadota bacterium]
MPQEYLTEIFYPSRFYDFMSPALLSYLAVLHGFESPPVADSFDYCELGCGGGMTVLTLAASCPHGRFYGVDMNPEHIDYAQKAAEATGLDNLTLIESDFDGLDLGALPNFDFITVHGVYSWVSEDTREQLVKILERKLKPGGLLMISYNAMPGAAATQPIREMMLTHTEGMAEPTREKVEEAIRYLKYLAEHNAAYFEENPVAREAVEGIADKDRDYLAHEFFNEHWKPFYFIEVARDMSRAGLTFVGTLPVVSNYLETTVPSEFHSFFHTAPDRIALERHKAFVRNERFRRDVYIKTDEEMLPEPERIMLYKDLCFGTDYDMIRQEASIQNAVDTIKLDYSQPPHSVIASRLLGGGHNIEMLKALPELEEFSEEDIVDAVNLLILGGDFRPFTYAGNVLPIPPDPGTYLTIPVLFNQVILENCHLSDEPAIYLASPVLGDGYAMALVDGMLLWGLTQVNLEEVPSWALARMHGCDKHLNIEGKPLNDPEAELEVLQQQLDVILTHKLGKFIELGLVAPSA